MKKIRFVFLITIIMLLYCIPSYAAVVKTEITKVEITGIAYPYSTGSTLDTTADVTEASKSTVSNVAWSKNSSGLYVVTIKVRPNINCYYAETGLTATVNGNAATSTKLDDDKFYLEITYVFPEDNTQPNPNSANTLRHAIYATYSRYGTIEPVNARVNDGKSITMQIIPNEGYKIRDVVVDGESVGAVSEYTFRKVKESHKISAYYELIEESDEEESEEDLVEETLVIEENYTASVLFSTVKIIMELILMIK